MLGDGMDGWIWGCTRSMRLSKDSGMKIMDRRYKYVCSRFIPAFFVVLLLG